jgi:hypothetical protein
MEVRCCGTPRAKTRWGPYFAIFVRRRIGFIASRIATARTFCDRTRICLTSRCWEHLSFPFRHTAFWANTDPVELRRYMDVFGRITKLIEESELAGVRNGLDHFKQADRFPSTDKLLACVARLREALELGDVHRYFPKLFWLFGRKGNRFGSVEYEFRDAAGRSTFTYGPPLASGLPRNMYGGAYLLSPASLLGSPQLRIGFRVPRD